MAREKDEDAERNPETRGSIDKRREERAEISRGYREARQELPDNPRDDPWGYTELPARNPAENVVPPLWERIRSNALTVSQLSEQSDDPPSFLLAKALGNVQLYPHYWHPGVNEDLTQNLEGDDATRLYLFFDLSPLNQSEVSRKVKKKSYREALDISDSVSQPTLNRMPGRMDSEAGTTTRVRLRHWFGSGKVAPLRIGCARPRQTR